MLWYSLSILHSCLPMATFRLLRFPQRGRQRSSMNGYGYKLHPVNKSTHIEHLCGETSRSLHPSIEGLTGLNNIFCLGDLKPHYHSEAVSLRQLLASAQSKYREKEPLIAYVQLTSQLVVTSTFPKPLCFIVYLLFTRTYSGS